MLKTLVALLLTYMIVMAFVRLWQPPVLTRKYNAKWTAFVSVAWIENCSRICTQGGST